MDFKGRRIITYAAYGFILGMFFPFIATLTEVIRLDINLTYSAIRAIHLAQPLMLLIDVAPIILSASYALIGIQAGRYQETSNELNQRISLEATKIENEQYFLEALISSTSFAIVRLDTDHHVITCNKAFEDLFGYKCDEIIGAHLDDLIASGELHDEASQISDNVSKGNLARKVSKRNAKDGRLVDVEVVGIPVSVGGENIGILGLYHDITERKRTEKALTESEERFRSLFNESPISLWEEDFSEVKKILEKIGDKDQIIDRLNQDYLLTNQCLRAVKILNVNQATIDLYNAETKENLLQNLSEFTVIESLEEFRNELIALVNGETSFECEIYNKKLTGELIYGWLRLSLLPGSENTWGRVQISIIDITERKEAEEKLRFMSFHDALTGVYNRAYFEEELNRLSNGRQYPVSIISCDLDELKQINDKLGHEAGDRAIKAAAKVLGLHTFRKEDVVARIGGDEFVVILPSVDLNKTPTILNRIKTGIEKFNASQLDDGLYRPISISLGYAVITEGEDLREGYKKADKAMYTMKAKRKAEKS